MKNFPKTLRDQLFVIGGIAVVLTTMRAQDAPSTPTASPCPQPQAVKDPDRMVRAKYPKKSLDARAEGTVELKALVGANGKTQDLKVVKGDPAFAAAALDAVRKWRFHPAVVKGEAVETVYKVRVRFVLSLQEAIAEWEIESPQDKAPLIGASSDFPADTADGPVYKVSTDQGVIAPRPTYAPNPEFREKGPAAKVQGVVTVTLIVDTDGRPRNVKVACSSAPALDEDAVETVKTWRFEPGTKDGKPVMVAMAVQVECRFYSRD